MSTDNCFQKNFFKILFSAIVFFFCWFMPPTWLGIPDLSIVEQRVIAIFLLALCLWMTDALPSWTTSVLIIVLLILTCSDSSFSFFRLSDYGSRQLGSLLSHKEVMATFADPVIMLFLGGFVLAHIASKQGIDVHLAKVLLKPFGNRSEFVLLGFLLVTGFFSMFISNTATAAMMLTFLAPVLRSLPVDGKGRIGLALAIPIGANIGGIATPIGTPPNAIAMKYLNDPTGLDLNIGFGQWCAVMMPVAIILLLIAWIVLIKLFPFKQKVITLKIEGDSEKSWKTTVTYITLIITILLWVFDKFTGVNSYTVALIPLTVFCITGIFTKDDLMKLNWNVLWLVAGGFALGVALNGTGLAKHLIQAIPFHTWSPLAVIIGTGLLCWFMSNIISHSATAALLLPVMITIGLGMQTLLEPFGGIKTLLIGVTVASSLGMMLPISTPPNAIAYSTGFIKIKEMEIMGIIMGIVGVTLAYLTIITVGRYGLI